VINSYCLGKYKAKLLHDHMTWVKEEMLG